MSKTKMRVFYELCYDLMEALAGIAICENGACPVNEVGKPDLSDADIAIVEQYICKDFQSLTDEANRGHERRIY